MGTRHDIGVASSIGTYSDAVEVPAGARWLVRPGFLLEIEILAAKGASRD
jgi:hypothetical protein